jgi:hypothetical protein
MPRSWCGHEGPAWVYCQGLRQSSAGATVPCTDPRESSAAAVCRVEGAASCVGYWS